MKTKGKRNSTSTVIIECFFILFFSSLGYITILSAMYEWELYLIITLTGIYWIVLGFMFYHHIKDDHWGEQEYGGLFPRRKFVSVIASPLLALACTPFILPYIVIKGFRYL